MIGLSIRVSLLVSVCPSVTVFRTFLLHALWYWAEILHMTLFECTTDQVLVSSIFVGVMLFWNLQYCKYNFCELFSYVLWHIELKFCIWLLFHKLQIKFECDQFSSRKSVKADCNRLVLNDFEFPLYITVSCPFLYKCPTTRRMPYSLSACPSTHPLAKTLTLAILHYKS